MPNFPLSYRKKYAELRLLREARGIATWVGESPQGRHLIKVHEGEAPQFQREFEFLSTIQHPGLPRAVAYEKNGETEIYVREYVEGAPLQEYFGVWDRGAVISAIASISRALAALHFHGFAHGDLSAGNVIVNAEGRPVLIDFEFLAPRHRSTGEIRGTPRTMAPELFWGKPPTIQTDLYALGCLLYALLSGRYPFSGKAFHELLQQHALETPPDPTLNLPQFPRALGLLAMRLLSKDPGSRFAEANDVIRGLNAALHLEEALEAAPPQASERARLKASEVVSQESEALAYLGGKKELSREERVTWCELLLRHGRFEALEALLTEVEPDFAWLLRGLMLNRQGRYREAVLHFSEQPEASDPRAIIGRATALYYEGEIEQSLACLHRASELDSSAKGMIAVKNFQGNLFWFERRLAEAKENFLFGLQAAQGSGAVVQEALALMNLGNVEASRGEVAEALVHYEMAVELYQSLGLFMETAKAKLNLSGLLRFFGHFEKAESLMEEARDCLRLAPNLQLQAYADLLATDLSKKRGQLDAALQGLARAEENLRLNPSLCDEGDLWVSFAEVQLALENKAEVDRFLSQARALSEKSQDPVLSNRILVLEVLRESLDSRSLAAEKIYFPGQRLIQQGDAEFILDNLTRGQRLAKAAGIDWPRPLAEWARGILEHFIRIIPEDYRPFFKSVYRELWEERAMENLIPFPAEKREKETLATVLDWMRELNGELDLGTLSEKILERMMAFTRMERGFVLMKDGEVLHSRHIRPEDVRPEGPESLSWSLTKKALAQGQPLATVDTSSDDRVSGSESVRMLGLRSILVLPFHCRGEVLGAVYLDSRTRGEHLLDQDLPYLAGLAEIVGLAVRNAEQFERKDQDLYLAKRALAESREALQGKYRYENIVGSSQRTRAFLQRVDRVTDVTLPVLILGESGVGKELIARAIHCNGPLQKGPFVSANCAAIPEALVESELFGHERGAFTGALQRRTGLFEQAHHGTLFLDEIGDMPLAAQGKLLRVLQDGEIRRVGGSGVSRVEVRVVAATHRDLKAEMKKGKFREDLYYRLSVAEIAIPPLRERVEDIPLLVDHFLEMFAQKNKSPKKKMERKALETLLRYAWPGNIRELENFIYQLCIFSAEDGIRMEDLSQKPELADLSLNVSSPSPAAGGLDQAIDQGLLNLSEAKRQFEREQIVRALALTQGKVGDAAQHLGIPRPQLSRLLGYHQLERGKRASSKST